MKLLCALLVLAFASCTYAVVLTQFLYYKTQDRPEGFEGQQGCYVYTINKVVPFDRPIYGEQGSCTKYTCDEETLNAYELACDSVKPKKGCKVVEDDTQKYPACCPRQQCDGD